jgi:hypothetical protein
MEATSKSPSQQTDTSASPTGKQIVVAETAHVVVRVLDGAARGVGSAKVGALPAHVRIIMKR